MVFAFPVVGLLGGLLYNVVGGHRLGMGGLVQVGCVMLVDGLVDSKSDRAYARYYKSGCEDVPARLQDSFADGLSTVYV